MLRPSSGKWAILRGRPVWTFALLATNEWHDDFDPKRGKSYIARDGGVIGHLQLIEVEPQTVVIDQVLVLEERSGFYYTKATAMDLRVRAVRDRLSRKVMGASSMVVSPDSPKKHVKFREKYGLPFTLLADEDHAVAEAGGDLVRCAVPRDDDVRALERIVVRTRRYAAYQRKWMRRIPGLVSLPADRPPGEVADAILEVARARQRLPAGPTRRPGRAADA